MANGQVQSAAAQDVDRGSWLGPPLDCNILFVATVRLRTVCPWATVAPSGRWSSYRIARRAAISFLERRSAVTASGRGRTFRFSGGRSRQVSVRQRWTKRLMTEKWTKSGGRGDDLFVINVFVFRTRVSGVPDFSAAPDVWRRTAMLTGSRPANSTFSRTEPATPVQHCGYVIYLSSSVAIRRRSAY